MLLSMPLVESVAIIREENDQKFAAAGGIDVWNSLPEDAKDEINAAVYKKACICLGVAEFEKLTLQEKQDVELFIWAGCCMHKDLNCVKGGDKVMQGMWTKEKKTPPILLANKDNTAVLASQTESSASTHAELQAEEVSKCGGSHATTLGGMICRNKDKKKGQQDTYDYYMQYHVGYRVPYPDVSNTRYGSHGEAAETIIAYCQHFINFMAFVRNAKDKPGETNIEKNFANALKDMPTVTELCVLALYNVNVSRPFIREYHGFGNP